MKVSTLLPLTLAAMVMMTLCSCGPFGIIPLAGAAAGAGGGGDGKKEGPLPLEIVSITPQDGQTNIDIYSPVTVIFNQAVDPATVTGATFSVGGYAGSYYFYDGYSRVIFASSSAFPTMTSITVAINGIRAMGNPSSVIAGFSSQFTTGGFSTAPPYIISVMPDDDTTVTHQNFLPVKIFFSKPMNTGTVDSSSFYIFHLNGSTPLNGTVSWDAEFREFTFYPSDSLTPGNNYEIRVMNTVQSSDGYTMTSAFVSTFTTIDLTPYLLRIPAGISNPENWINASTEFNVTVEVEINDNTQAWDWISLRISDGGSDYWYGTQAMVDGPAFVQIPGINASGLSEGPITLEVTVWRNDFGSDPATGSATKDTSPPIIGLVSPSQIPAYYELRALEFDMSIDSNCTLHLTGGGTNQSVPYAAGTYAIDYNLRVADRNNVDIYATDDAGNESSHISQTVYQRGGASGGPVGGAMQVAVYRESDLTPVANAMVVCGYSSQVLYTDSEGIVTFNSVSGPQAVTIIHAGYPIFSLLDVNAARVSLPFLDDTETTTPRYASVQGTVAPIPASGMFHYTHEVDWSSKDENISGDGDFSVRIKPNRFYTLSAIDNTGVVFSDFVMKNNLGPLNEGQNVIENLTFGVSAPSLVRVDSGDITLPNDYYLPAPIIWERGNCFVMSRARAESDRFLCGFGTFPWAPTSGGPFAYSSIQPGYFLTPSNEYWLLLNMKDIRGRKVAASKKFIDGDSLPDFFVPDMPVLSRPGTSAVETSLTPTFEWSDSNSSGLHILQIVNRQNGNAWIVAREAGFFNATLPHIPDYAPVKVMENSYPAAEMMWRIESIHMPGPFDFNDFTNAEFELGFEYRLESEWRNFCLWNPTDTNGRIPEFGAAGEPTGSLTVTIVDMEIESPIQGVTVFLGDDPAGALVTDAFGRVVFNGLSGPVKLTYCYHMPAPFNVDMMMTFDQVQCAYATMPVLSMKEMDGEPFQLYGEVFNLPTGNEGWVTATDNNYSDFNISDPSGIMDGFGNTSYDGPSPENYSMACRDRGKPYSVTGFYGVAVGDAIFDYAYFSDPFLVQPYDLPYYKVAPDIDYNASSALGFSPMRRVTDPSEMWIPTNVNLGGGATVEWKEVEPFGTNTNNPWGEDVVVKLGQGQATEDAVNPNLYLYGITFASPPNINIETLGLLLRAGGYNADGTDWDSEVKLDRLQGYPSRYDFTLPPVPYPISPQHGDFNVGIPINFTWENSLQGKEGLYMIMLNRMVAPRPFAWMILKPATVGLTASITVPVQPPAYDGPELGELSKFSINANSVPGFDPASWHGVVFEKYDDGRAEWGEGDFTP